MCYIVDSKVNRTFIHDRNVVKEAHALCTQRLEEFLRMQTSEELGVPPDEVTFEYEEPEAVTGSGSARRTICIKVPSQYVKNGAEEIHQGDTMSLYSRWFIEAMMYLYSIRLRDAERARYINPAQSRFLRAYQAFTNSFRMDDPFRYVARTTCLEALLGVDNAELAFQLASRAAWLLKPTDPEARSAIYENVKQYYGLRCKIVHGDTYSPSKLDDYAAKLLALVRELLGTAILDDRLYKLFFEAGKKPCNDFLQKLSIGCASIQQAAPPAE